jgi:hypothetical protein
MRRCRWGRCNAVACPKTRAAWGGAVASDFCAFIADVTLAVDAEVTAIGCPDDH